MANWGLPTLSSTYTNFIAEAAARDESCALWFNSATVADTNVITGTVRWNATNLTWEKWSGTAWGALSSTYGISITGYSTNIGGGAAGQMPYQIGSNSTGMIGANAAATKMFLSQSSSALPAWSIVTKADVGLGSVENTALSTWAGSTNITSIGTINNPNFSGTANIPNIAASFIVKSEGGAEGGQFYLEKPATGSTLVGNIVVDISTNTFRVFESGGTLRGFNIDLTTCAASVGSTFAFLNGASNQNFSTQSLYAYGTSAIINTGPVLSMRDTDGLCSMLHVNTDTVYLLRSSTNNTDTSTAYTNGRWPLSISLLDNSRLASFGGGANIYGDVNVKNELTGVDTLVTSEGGTGYGAFYSKSAAANASHHFFGNITSGETGRISSSLNSLVLSTDAGTTSHLSITPTTTTINGTSTTVFNNTSTLGSVAGNNLPIQRITGKASNTYMNNIWLLRKTNGADWYTTVLHDAISVDSSFLTPGTDTLSWYERNPGTGTHMWGHGSSGLMSLNGSGNLSVSTVNSVALAALTTGFSVAGGTTSKTLTVNNTLGLSGTDGKTLTYNKSLTLTATNDTSTLNIATGGTLGTAAFINTNTLVELAGTQTITGLKDFNSGAGQSISITSSANTLEAYATEVSSGSGYGAAMMNFNRPGIFKAHFGIDTDNQLSYGGGSETGISHKILHSGNYNTYAPTKTGTGASGTWGIHITGNAATATTADTVTFVTPHFSVGNAILAGITFWSGAHGFAGIPSLYNIYLRCDIADQGYIAGDYIEASNIAYYASGDNSKVTLWANATTIGYSVRGDRLYVANKTTGAGAFLNRLNWTIIIRAWRN